MVLERRSLLVAATLLLLGGLWLQIAAYWPGIVVWDSIRQYGQALSGRFDDWHPPAFEWLWRKLIPLKRGPAPMIMVQMLFYWGGFALLASWASLTPFGLSLSKPCSSSFTTEEEQGFDKLSPNGMRKYLPLAIAAVAFLPIPFALTAVVLKDSLMAGLLLTVTGLLAWSGGRGRPILRAIAALLLLCAAMIRFNAFLAGLPLLVALLPERWRSTPARMALVSCIAALPLIAALPVANRLLGAERSGVELSLVIYDLGGITEMSGANVFPPQPVANPVEVNRRCYSPEKWDYYAWWVDEPCPIGFDSIRAELKRSGENPYRLWLKAILAHPLAYAEHRLLHFNSNIRFLTRGRIERPVPDQSDPNSWGFRIEPNPAQAIVDQAALASEATPLGWPVWWMALALGALILAPGQPSRTLTIPLALSVLLYALGYAVFSVASEMRYHFWTMSGAAVAALIALAEIRAASRRQRLMAAAPLVLVTLFCVLWRAAPLLN